MADRGRKIIIIGLIVLVFGLAFQNMLLGRQVRRLEEQIGEQLFRTVSILTGRSGGLFTDLLRYDISLTELTALERSIQLSYLKANSVGLSSIAYYYELMLEEINCYNAGEAGDKALLIHNLRQLNAELDGLLALLQGRDEDIGLRSARDYYNWVTGRNRELSTRVTEYVRQGR